MAFILSTLKKHEHGERSHSLAGKESPSGVCEVRDDISINTLQQATAAQPDRWQALMFKRRLRWLSHSMQLHIVVTLTAYAFVNNKDPLCQCSLSFTSFEVSDPRRFGGAASIGRFFFLDLSCMT